MTPLAAAHVLITMNSTSQRFVIAIHNNARVSFNALEFRRLSSQQALSSGDILIINGQVDKYKSDAMKWDHSGVTVISLTKSPLHWRRGGYKMWNFSELQSRIGKRWDFEKNPGRPNRPVLFKQFGPFDFQNWAAS